jgi:hypothetical protein
VSCQILYFNLGIWEIKADLLREQWSLKNFFNEIDGRSDRAINAQSFLDSFEGGTWGCGKI